MSDNAPQARYTPLGEVARGGMGVVLRVRDRTLDRTLALKRMLAPPTEADGELEVARFARFMEEAQITAQLDHPSIVPIHELGEDEEGRTYYTMRLVKGHELGEVMREVNAGRRTSFHGKVPGRESKTRNSKSESAPDRSAPSSHWNLSRLVGVLVRVCQTMAYAHGKGVIHRDLKPANIMVGDLGEVYVMDWGLARMAGRAEVRDLRWRLEQEGVDGLTTVVTTRGDGADALLDAPLQTMDGAVIGTPAYMAPEQAAGRIEEVDSRSDIYSLGAILYELLAGHPPFLPGGAARSPRSVLHAVRTEAPERLAGVAADAPPELIAICEKAMQREKAARYPSCLDLAEELQAFLDNRVVKAHQTGPLAEARAWVRRNRALAAAVLVALMAIIAGLAATAYVRSRSAARLGAAFVQERQAKDEAVATLVESLHQQGAQYHAQGDRALALAYWARALHYDPAHARAAARITAVLQHETVPLPLRALPVVPGGLSLVRFSPDGTMLAAVSGTNAVEVFWAATGQRRFTFPTSLWTRWVEFDPGGNRLAVTGSEAGYSRARIECFELTTGRPAFAALDFSATVPRISFSADGSRFTAPVLDGVARVWAAADGRLIFSAPPPSGQAYATAIHTARLNGDGRRLLLGRGDGSVELHDVDAGRRVFQVPSPRGAIEPVLSIAWSPDETQFAAGGLSGAAQVFEAASGRPVSPSLAHALGVDEVAFHPGGRLLLTGSRDGEARVWEIPSGVLAGPPLRHQAALRQVGFSADGSNIVTACEDGTARLWSTATGRELSRTSQRGDQVWRAELNPAGTLLVTASRNHGAVLWETARPVAQPWLLKGENLPVLPLPGTNLFVSAGAGKLRLVEADTGKIRHEVEAHPGTSVSRLAVSADGRRLATAGNDSQGIRLWELDRGLTLAGVWGEASSYDRIALASNGQALAAVTTGRSTLHYWSNLAIQAAPVEIALGFRPEEIRFGAQGDWLAMVGYGVTNWLWRLPQGLPVGGVSCRAFDQAADGRCIVAEGARARFWDPVAGQPLTTPRALTHLSQINAVKFSPDGGRVLTVSADNTARIWDAQTGEPLTEPLTHRYQALSGCWSPDGRRVATTALDQTLTLWDAATGERLAGPLACPPPLREPQNGRPMLRGFLADGRRVLTWNAGSGAGRADVWDLGPSASEPIPAWLGPLAEAVAGLRVERVAEARGFRTLVHEVPIAERTGAWEKFGHLSGADPYSQLARWYFADPAARGVSPSAPPSR